MIKKLKELSENSELDNLFNSLPSDEEICKKILCRINNPNVVIKTDLTYNSSLYTVYNNTITIGKIKSTFLKPQTIAHECRHSVQPKFIAWTNFIVSNLFIFLYIVGLICTIFNWTQNKVIIIALVSIIAIIQWSIRTYLEIDAILNSKNIAKEYLSDEKIIDNDGLKKLEKQYEMINKLGITIISFGLLLKKMLEITILVFLNLI